MIVFGKTHYAIHEKSFPPYGPGRECEELEHLASLCEQIWPYNWPWPSDWYVRVENGSAIVQTPRGVKAAYPLNNPLGWKAIFGRQAQAESENVKQ